MLKHEDPIKQLEHVVKALARRYEKLFLWARDGQMARRGFDPAEKKRRALEEVKEAELGDCTRCNLSRGRHQLVLGEGNPSATLMLIGEAPGRDEDFLGRPFVGWAGQLLSRILQEAGLRRDEVYITNVLKCRPPANRTPEPEEIITCVPFLLKQIRIIDPKVILLLGSIALKALLGSEKTISRMRGQELTYEGRVVIPTYHPAFVLRNPQSLDTVRSDVFLAYKALKREANACEESSAL
jgi:DNA polymerase